MIKEEYVSFEVARLLNDKGFNEPTIGTYNIESKNPILIERPIRAIHCEAIISAPTQAMAMMWLREVHKCYITFTWEFKEYDKNYKPIYKDITWSFNIAIPKYNSARKGDGSYFDLDSDKEYDSYEQACEAAIKYCLENLI